MLSTDGRAAKGARALGAEHLFEDIFLVLGVVHVLDTALGQPLDPRDKRAADFWRQLITEKRLSCLLPDLCTHSKTINLIIRLIMNPYVHNEGRVHNER